MGVRYHFIGMILLLGFAFSFNSSAQITGIGFRVPSYRPDDTLQSVLIGKKVQQMKDGRMKLTGVENIIYEEDGETPDLVLESVECIYDKVNKAAFSSESIKVFKKDGSAVIKGLGFRLRLDDSSLVISNKVDTLIRKKADLVEGESELPGGEKNSPKLGDPNTLEIHSGRFIYAALSDSAVFRQNVNIIDPQGMNIQCGVLQVPLQVDAQGNRVIEADIDVRIRIQDENRGLLESTAEKAIFLFESGQVSRVELTGSPSFTTDEYKGSGSRMLLEPAKNSLHVIGDGILKVDRRRFGRSTIVGEGSPDLGNAVIEIRSDEYRFQENKGVFSGNIQLIDPEWTMTCGDVEIELDSAQRQFNRLIARNKVELIAQNLQADQQGTVLGNRADYYLLDGQYIMDITENPTWNTDKRNGQGDLIRLDPANKRITVLGNAVMYSVVDDNYLKPANTTSTLEPVATKTAESSSEKQLEIHSDQYFYQEGLAEFSGKVYADLSEMQIRCGKMVIVPPESDHASEKLTASENVFLELKKQAVFAAGAKAVYTASDQNIRLSGNPVLKTPDLTIPRAETLIWNLERGTYRAVGPYRVRGLAKRLNTETSNPTP